MSEIEAKILIVEDNKSIAESVQMALEFEGYTSLTAENGKVGIETLNNMKKKPNLILLDLMMPVMDGWQFIEELNKLPEYDDILIAVMSAFPDPEKFPKRPKWFLEKPTDFNLLIKIIKETCGPGSS